MLKSLFVAMAALLCCGVARSPAATQAQIDQALQRGVEHLKRTQAADGSWNYAGYMEGATSLAALALLESGTRASDPAILKAAQFVRAKARACTQTYSLSLMIFFLDRLGDRRDQPLIATLGERLRDGQSSGGGWTYMCAAHSAAGGGVAGFPAMPGNFGGDNSNTQFALLGLWVARRHNVNVKQALERVDKYFRNSQGQDGGWNYNSAGGGAQSAGAMTCAGLLGLLVQYGNEATLRAGQAKDLTAKPAGKPAAPGAGGNPLKDPVVQAGLKCLEQCLAPQGNAFARLGLASELYFLWSVERVGVAYGLKKIGNADWYALGAARILATQHPDGSWPDYAPNVGTSLALLFLKRANVASDLTRLVGGETTLRSGDDLEALKVTAAAAANSPPVAAAAVRSGEIETMSPGKLKAALPELSDKQQAAVLVELRDRKGGEATLALAGAIAVLNEPQAGQARQFLVQRLNRMTPATLARYLAYDDPAIRLAAAKAAAAKSDPALVGPLIELLSQRDTELGDAAHAALVKQTGQQFGPFVGKSTVERFVVIQRWKAWWEKKQ